MGGAANYQRIHRLADGSMRGVEALVRWNHPSLGAVPPSVFIPIAEVTDVILPIGAWVLATACQQVATWRELGLAPDLTVSVNLSARQLQHQDVVAEVADVLRWSGLPAGALVLEVTESVLVEDLEAASDHLAGLRRLGVRIAIDDFGTGYATLGYLRELPVDILKIDKSFIDDVCAGPERSALARAVVRLGRTVGLSTTAEGIERPEQLELLRQIGCDDGQGYLFARPMHPQALHRRLEEAGPVVLAAPSAS